MIKGVIFDLDGVIVFTDKYHYLAWKAIADEENIYFDEQINHLLRGVSRMESLNIILRKATKCYTEKEKEELAYKKNEIYKNYLQTLNKNNVSLDVINTLKTLKEKNIKIAIGSSSKNTKLILSKIGLLDMFDCIVDGNDIKHSKPNPEVFLKAAEKLMLNPSDCLVIEDAESGIDAAIDGGFISVGIGNASKYNKTKYKIDNVKEIINLL